MVPDPRLDASHHKEADQVLSSLLDFSPIEWDLPPFWYDLACFIQFILAATAATEFVKLQQFIIIIIIFITWELNLYSWF